MTDGTKPQVVKEVNSSKTLVALTASNSVYSKETYDTEGKTMTLGTNADLRG